MSKAISEYRYKLIVLKKADRKECTETNAKRQKERVLEMQRKQSIRYIR